MGIKKSLDNQLIIKALCLIFVGVPRFELGTPCSQSRCANRAALHPELNYSIYLKRCGERGIRTLGTVTRTSVQQTGGFSHSPIPPKEIKYIKELPFLLKRCKDIFLLSNCQSIFHKYYPFFKNLSNHVIISETWWKFAVSIFFTKYNQFIHDRRTHFGFRHLQNRCRTFLFSYARTLASSPTIYYRTL